jgi:hypothetical protein
MPRKRDGLLSALEDVTKERDDLKEEVTRLQQRLLMAAGDDLCRLTQEEIKAMTAGEVQIPPIEEFIPSCRAFHAQVAGTAGVLPNCLTMAQLIAENEQLRIEAQSLQNQVDALNFLLHSTDE